MKPNVTFALVFAFALSFSPPGWAPGQGSANSTAKSNAAANANANANANGNGNAGPKAGDGAGANGNHGGSNSGVHGASDAVQELSEREVLEAVEAGRAVSLSTILPDLRTRTGGEVINAQLQQAGAFLLYAVTVLTPEGRVATEYYYARSGLHVGD